MTAQYSEPGLRPGYDTGQDCLIVIDATSESNFDAALDELATFGSRYARLIVIAQQAFALDGRPMPLSDFLLPVVVNLLGTAMRCVQFVPAAQKKDFS